MAGKVYGFVEAAADAIGTALPPKRQRNIHEPRTQRCALSIDVVHCRRHVLGLEDARAPGMTQDSMLGH